VPLNYKGAPLEVPIGIKATLGTHFQKTQEKIFPQKLGSSSLKREVTPNKGGNPFPTEGPFSKRIPALKMGKKISERNLCRNN